MANVNPAKKGVGYVTYIPGIPSFATPGTYQVNPTIAAGDFQYSADGGAWTNPATIPVVTPAGGTGVKITLSASEMNCDVMNFRWIDQTAQKEWADGGLDAILTTNANGVDANVTAVAGTAQTAGDLAALLATIPTANANADALLDRAAGVETGVTPRQGLRLILAAIVGKLSGAATTTVTIRDTTDSKNRVIATVDSSGNRSAVTLDAS